MRIVKRIGNAQRRISSSLGIPRRSRGGRPVQPAGRHTYGVANIQVLSWGEGARLTVGSFCSIADHVTVFLGGNHRTDWISTYPFAESPRPDRMIGDRPGHPQSNGDVWIGHDVWIGSHVSIMSGVTIESGAVLAAHSHIVRDVAAYEVVGGNPARHIRFRVPDAFRARLLALTWWDLPDQLIADSAHLLCAPPTEESLRQLESMVRDWRGAEMATRDSRASDLSVSETLPKGR